MALKAAFLLVASRKYECLVQSLIPELSKKFHQKN